MVASPRPNAGPAFIAYELEDDVRVERGGEHPTALRTWSQSALALAADATHFVYAMSGAATLEASAGRFELARGMYAALPGAGRLSGAGSGIVVSRLGYRGMLLIGGPIEARGRLRYIDGCTDSLLLAPPVAGDPCLNHLHIPAGTRQTAHTHPSLRAGIIARGTGRCITRDGEHTLAPGLVFMIEPHALHAFHTDADALDVVVYHPDSDTGPTDDDHPMRNRTFIDGRSR